MKYIKEENKEATQFFGYYCPTYLCGNCKHELLDDFYSVVWNYCPNCGCKVEK